MKVRLRVCILALALPAAAAPSQAAVRGSVSLGFAPGRGFRSGAHSGFRFGYSRFGIRPSCGYSPAPCGGYYPYYPFAPSFWPPCDPRYSDPFCAGGFGDPFHDLYALSPSSVWSRYFSSTRPSVVELPPRVVYVSPDTEGRQPRRREGVEDSYYLDWRRDVHPEPERPPERAREPQPEGLLLLARRQFRVESAEPGVYLVRWTGPAAEASLVEFQSLDKEGQVLHSRLLARAPFRCLLRVPVETASVVVTAEYREGLRTDLKLSVAEFKSLADRVDLPDRKSGTR